MVCFRSTVVCFAVIGIYGCDQSQPAHLATIDPAGLESEKPINSIGMEFKLIPAGKFTMGEGDDAHEVTVDKAFMMGIHEVTQIQYLRVMNVNPSQFEGADHPVQKVNWYEAVEFCEKLNELPFERAAGHVYRLPTDAEWEYACRAGTTTRFSFGDDESELSDYGWYSLNAGGVTHPVGGKKANEWGLFDMHGNVWEWCNDTIGNSLGRGSTDIAVAALGSGCVGRGGGYYGPASDTRSAARSSINPAFGSGNLGFRVCLSPAGE